MTLLRWLASGEAALIAWALAIGFAAGALTTRAAVPAAGEHDHA